MKTAPFVLLFILSLTFSSEVLPFRESKLIVSPDDSVQTVQTTKVNEWLLKADQQQELSPLKALNCGKQAIVLAGKIENSELLMQAYYQTSLAYFKLGKLDSCQFFCKKIVEIPTSSMQLKAMVNNYMCISYRKMGRYDKALNFGQTAIENYKMLGDSIGMAGATLNRAKVYHVTGDNKSAMIYFFDVLKLFEIVGDTLKQGQVLGLISNVYMEIDQEQNGVLYLKKTIKLLKKYPNNTLYGDALNNYGIIFYDRKEYDSALFYFQQALQVYLQTDKEDAIAVSYENSGISLIYLGQIQKGLNSLHLALKMFKELGLDDDKVSALLDLGQAFIEIGKIDSAAFYLNESLKLSKHIHNTFGEKESLFMLYTLNKKVSKFQDALNWYQYYVDFKDSLDNNEMQKNLQELEVKYQSAQREKEILHLKDQELLDRADKRFLTVGIIGLVIFFILTLTLILMKRKKDLQIHRQKVLVHQKEKALTEVELARREAHEIQLENELEFKTKQLATHALNMMQKNKLLQEMTESIGKQMKNMDGNGRGELRRFRQELQQGMNVDKDWDLFKLYFEQIHERFFGELKKINPNLTGNDYKLCALIKLNMSVKEMASVMNISADSLKNGRYRLKKKLKLKPDDRLNIFINNI